MRGWIGVLVAGIVLYLAAAAEQSLGPRTLFGGRFDYLLIAVACVCLFTSRKGGAVAGFFAGLLYGALDGANMWQYVLTRTLGGYFIAIVASGGIERSLFAAFLAAVFATIFCQLTLMFLAPPPAVLPFLLDTISTAVYNGVLAMAVYAVLNRILGPRKAGTVHF